ncbi:MAG: hypothetical protein R2719_14440 [Micropruina sp.]
MLSESLVLSVSDNTTTRAVLDEKVSVPVRSVHCMNRSIGSVSVVDFTTGITGLLDTIDTDVRLLTDRAQLDLVADLLRIQSRLAGVLHTVLGVVDRAEAAQTAYGVPLTSWLAGELRYTRPQAAAMVHHAKDLERFIQVGWTQATAAPTIIRPGP